MKLRTVTVACGDKINFGDYESICQHVELTYEIGDDEDEPTMRAAATNQAFAQWAWQTQIAMEAALRRRRGTPDLDRKATPTDVGEAVLKAFLEANKQQ